MYDWIPDLILNLIAEITGIFVTVLLIDRLLKKREEAKWLPSKYFLYSRLIGRFDNLLYATAPFMMSGVKYIYEFGDAVVTTWDARVEFSSPESNKELWLKVKEYSDELSLDNKAEILNKLSQEKDEIDKILASSIALVEPELSSSLMKLQRVLGDASGIASTLYLDQIAPSFEFADNADLFTMFNYSIVEAVQKTKNQIVRSATNKRSIDEFASDLRVMIQQKK